MANPTLCIQCPSPATSSSSSPSSSSEASLLLKAIWTSNHYKNVNLQFSRGDSPGGGGLVRIQVGENDNVVTYCPYEENALALAVFNVSDNQSKINNKGTVKPTPIQQMMMVDEWCEWERTVLRPCLSETNTKKKTKQIENAVKHIEHGFHHSNSPHLLGHVESLADIVVVSTLKQIIDDDAPDITLPEIVATYVKSHEPAYNQAKVESVKQAKRLDCDYDPDDVSMFNVLESVFGTAIRKMLAGMSASLPKHFVSKCQNPRHGDYQCNAAMPVFAALKKSGNSTFKSPQNVAQAIIDTIGNNHPVIMSLEVNGPGFILCRIRPTFLEYHLNYLLSNNDGKLAFPVPETKQTCVVDFSSPNIAKEMHVGHLRSTIIGESVCRILEAVGHDVHRINHIGDWGTQFGMLIQYLLDEYPDVASGKVKELPNITDLTVFYKSAKGRFDSDEVFKDKSRTNVVKLQGGDDTCKRIWKLLCDISRHEFQKVYERLDVKTDEFGESFYNSKIPPVINEFRQAKLLQDEEGGAKVVFVDGYKVPLMLQKSDGGYGYDSTDMAALKYRLHSIKADRIIVITDFSQGDHFQMVYKAGRAIGWVDKEQRLEHIGFGTVMGEDGKRFKTRSGDTVRLVDLLDEAVNRMDTALKDRIAENKANITLEEAHQVAEAIGYGAVKYYDLRRNPTSNYKFSYDQMLDTKGDTAVYLLYARVRLESIMTKAKAEHHIDVEQDLMKLNSEEECHLITLGHASERSLALSLHTFADVIDATLEDLYPCRICEYVYKLSNACSDFITQCKVLGSPEMKSRLLLCYITANAMDQCFDLLGIRQVKRI